MIKIYLRRQPHTAITDVFIEAQGGEVGRGSIIGHFNFQEDGQSIISHEVYEPGVAQDFKPTFILGEMDLRELIQAFAALAKEEGIKLPDESFAKGKLEAISEHLKDMRSLVFEKK